jgi:endonuclease YncB( thermonuclease family)
MNTSARLASVLFGILTLLSAAAVADPVKAPVKKVVNGDTLILANGQRILLFGIDAPELHQMCDRGGTCEPCGEKSRDALYQIAAGVLTCEKRGKSLGMTVAQCSVGAVDLSQRMLRLGEAVVFNRYLTDGEVIPASYASAEEEAKAQKAGIWGVKIVDPWMWRHRGTRLPCEWQLPL